MKYTIIYFNEAINDYKEVVGIEYKKVYVEFHDKEELFKWIEQEKEFKKYQVSFIFEGHPTEIQPPDEWYKT